VPVTTAEGAAVTNPAVETTTVGVNVVKLLNVVVITVAPNINVSLEPVAKLGIGNVNDEEADPVRFAPRVIVPVPDRELPLTRLNITLGATNGEEVPDMVETVTEDEETVGHDSVVVPRVAKAPANALLALNVNALPERLPPPTNVRLLV
jgi:hypothetical protein